MLADDQSDYASLMSRIDGLLDSAKGNLSSAKGYQNDYAISYIDKALDNVKDVVSAADEARRKDVSTDDKRKADYHYEAARDFPDSAKAYAQIKGAEIKLKAAEYERTCDELNAKLKDQVERLVNDKDHEGERKIREFAENQARPIRERLNEVRSQDGYISSWHNTAKRFSYDRNKWGDVKSYLYDAADTARDGWKRLLENADRACEKIVKWEDNSIVRDGIRALAEKAKSKDEYINEINRELEQASRSLDSVERDSNESDILAAIRSAEQIENQLSRLKDVRGTHPKANHMTERWPEIVRQFKDRCNVLTKMKLNQFLVDRAQQTCQEAEAHRACDRVALGENDPEVKQILTGDCSESQLTNLHDKQIEWCKNKGTRSCKSLSTRSECQTAKDRLEINEQCVSFWQEIMTSCFKGGDARHRRELQDTQAVREVCLQKVKDLCN